MILLLETLIVGVFFFKQKTAYEMRISDWSSDVCSSDLPGLLRPGPAPAAGAALALVLGGVFCGRAGGDHQGGGLPRAAGAAAVRVDALARLEGIERTGAARGRALGAGRGGVPGRDRAVAGADAVDGAVRWRPGAPQDRKSTAGSADGRSAERRGGNECGIEL